MAWRALFFLTLAIGFSALATWYFGTEVLVALGLILVQIKVLGKKLWMIEWPLFFMWLKTQSSAFFRIELLKKWVMSTLVPLVMGRALLRRIKRYLEGYLSGVRALHARMMAWFSGLGRVEKALAWGVILSAMLTMSVTSLGLWLILFSVKLPLWLVAAAASLGKLIWVSTQKSLFKALAFLQLGWLWLGLQRLLPKPLLERKRRLEFRIARAVVRRRRLTVRQLADRKDRLPFRLGVLLEYIFRPGAPAPDNTSKNAADADTAMASEADTRPEAHKT